MRIFLILTDEVPSALIADLEAADLVLVGPNLEFKHPLAKIKNIGWPSSGAQEQLADQVAKSMESIPLPCKELLTSVVNELYAYVLRPLVSVVESVLIEIKKYPHAKLVVVHVNRPNTSVPLAGFVTTESLRGSKSLLGSYIAKQIMGIDFIKERTEFIHVNGDILCNEIYRSFILQTVDWLIRLKFAFVLIVIGLLKPKLHETKEFASDAVLIVRAFHQARFARRLCDAGYNHGIEVLVLPQFIQGGLIHTLRTLIPLVGEQRVTLPTFADVMTANRIAQQDKQYLIKFTNDLLNINLEIEGKKLEFRVTGLAKELSRLSILLLYRRLLAAFLQRRLVKRIINFELVGRIAGMDRLASDDASCKVATIQTALVSETPHPIFPHSHVFFADGPQSSISLKQIGALKRGMVEYAGCPVPVRPLKVANHPRVLVFCTQPYEREITILIIKSLVDYSIKRGCRLLVKAHPRDDYKYLDALGEDPNIAKIVPNSIDPQELILQSDVCITRTSSIARESLALGRPVILCLWSDFDNGVNADYIEHSGEFDHRVFCKQQLFMLLDDEYVLNGAAVNLRTRLFGNLQTSDLVRQVCSL